MSFNKSMTDLHQQHLERGWDPQVTHPGPPLASWKGNVNPDPNLKNLVIKKKLPAMHSAKTLPTRTTIDSTCSTTPSCFNSIAATFGFSHHVGTDKELELQVLKAILRRESALTKLQDTCTPKYNKIFLQNDTGTGVLDQLTSIRDVTVGLIETVTAWRQSQVNADPEIPRPFMYENQNYLLKIMFDMDFLADITPLVEALGLNGQKLRSNPLMMPESLDRANLGKDSKDSAAEDANGETSGSLFNERLRLRTVEQTLLREMDFNRKGAPSVAWGEDEKVDGGHSTFQESSTLATNSIDTDNTKARQADILGWYRQAQLQLIKLEEGIGEKLSAEFSSTYRLRLPVPEEEPLVRMSFSPSKLIPPTSLHEHASTVAEIPLPGPRSRTPSPTRQGGGFRKLRRLPSQQDQLTISTLSPALTWTRDDIQLLLELEQAPRCVALACASTLILLASGPQIPKNISWETFCLHANEAPIEDDMNAICPNLIPQFKIRAITPFLGSLTETFEEDLKSEDPVTQLETGHPRTEAIRKLVTWIMEVLNVATSTADQQGHPPPVSRLNSSQSTIDTIKIRRLESNVGLKKKQALERAKCPDDMKVKHSETVENSLLPDTSVTISLEIQKKKSANPATKRFVIKVFDENTFQYAQVAVNCKEYTSYMYDLREVFPGEELELYYEPSSSKWWAKYIKDVVTVTNQGSLSVRISKKAIRSIVAKQIKAKDDEKDSDLVSQDDEMASQQPLKKEKVPDKKKKKVSTKAKKEEAAAAAAKAKELEAKKKKEEADAKRVAAARKRKENEEAGAAESSRKKAEEDEAAAAKKKATDDEAARKVADEEAARKSADDEAARKAADEEAAAKNTADEEAAAVVSNKTSDEEKSIVSQEEKKIEADDDDEYDAEYDDENFVMTPKGGSPQKQDHAEIKIDNSKEEEKNEDQGGDDDYGDDYDDDNYDDESFSKSLTKEESPPPPAEKDADEGDGDDYGDDYDEEFDEEE